MENSPFIDGLPIKNGDFPWCIILYYTILYYILYHVIVSYYYISYNVILLYNSIQMYHVSTASTPGHRTPSPWAEEMATSIEHLVTMGVSGRSFCWWPFYHQMSAFFCWKLQTVSDQFGDNIDKWWLNGWWWFGEGRSIAWKKTEMESMMIRWYKRLFLGEFKCQICITLYNIFFANMGISLINDGWLEVD